MKVSPEAMLTAAMLSTGYPRLYHVAEENSWVSIQRHGLLSTTALLDLFGYAGPGRERIESQRRPKSVTIEHAVHGRAVIRDNIPMREQALEQCLEDLTPREWYEFLNRRVFFWLSRERLFKLLGARAYRGKRHTVLTVDTELLLQRHADRVKLSAINSGAALYKPQPRGTNTFKPIGDYPIGFWRQKRPWRNAIVELTVDYSVPDIRDLTLRVEHVEGGQVTEVLWER